MLSLTLRLVMAAALCAFVTVAHAADKVVFGLDWVPSGQHTPYYVAQEKGFFAANDLEVEMRRGYGSTDSVSRVATGATEIGFGDTAAVVLSRAKGLKVKVFAMIYGKAPYYLLLRQDSGVKSPKDLANKTLTAPAGGGARTMFPVFAKITGIDEDSVKWLTTDAASLLPILIAGRASGIAGYYVSHFTDEAKARQNGVATVAMRFSDYGLRLYSNGLVATDDTIRDRPDVLRRFVKALSEAFAYTFAHPEEAARLMVARNAQLDPELVVGDIAAVKDLDQTAESLQYGWGFMEAGTMTTTRDLVADVFHTPEALQIPIDDIYTNKFISH